MKINPLAKIFLLFMLVTTAFQVPAQQADSDRKQFKENKASAEKGDAKAQWRLGLDYYTGIGVAQDDVEASKWTRKAAEQNYDAALCLLGVFYQIGIGVPEDQVEAVNWFRKAADQGDAKAQYNLGYCYRKGTGVAQDDTEATEWFRKAAEQDDSSSQNALGACYARGEGVPRDLVEAYKWRNLAAAQGETNAVVARNALEHLMTPAQIAEAQELSHEFKPHKEFGFDNSVLPDNPTASGSGFFITDDGYLITNYHVVKDASKVRLLTGAGLIDAKVVQVDAANDLALLKAEGRFAPLPITSSRSVKLGGTVATVGFPDIGLQGFTPKFARGEIASLSGASDDARYFQISVPVQPGNSGGALVDEHGNVVGVVSAKLDASAALAASGVPQRGMNYAVKSSFLLSFLESVPAVSDKLKAPVTDDKKFSDMVQSAQDASVLVLVY
jgi:S1-C subfamily serine protease